MLDNDFMALEVVKGLGPCISSELETKNGDVLHFGPISLVGVGDHKDLGNKVAALLNEKYPELSFTDESDSRHLMFSW